MPQAQVKTYIRNGRTVRGYRRRTKGRSADTRPPMQPIPVSGFATTVSNIYGRPDRRQYNLDAAKAYNAAVADLNKLEAATDPPRQFTAKERVWAQMLYNSVIAMRDGAQTLVMNANSKNQRNAANRILDHVEEMDDRMYALFGRAGFEAKETTQQGSLGDRAGTIAFALLGRPNDINDSGASTATKKVIVGGKRAIDRVGYAVKDWFD